MKRVALVGTGLIGGSIGLALRSRDVEVVGFDTLPERAHEAVELGALDRVVTGPDACAGVDLAVVAVPVNDVVGAATALLDVGVAVVTDVASVKAPVVHGVEAARADAAGRFVGGHPMAGSEQEGVAGAESRLFEGSAWVLTPTPRTDADAFAAVRSLVDLTGGEAVALDPDEHDALVAMVSHVPQLAASTLMDLAAQRGADHRALLRLAAGGFRDMTRIAAADPAIWPDICVSNRDAIVAALDRYLEALEGIRNVVATGERQGLLEVLERARTARRNLPVGATDASDLVELRVPVADRPGVLAEVTTTAGRLGVNITDVEIAHSTEGRAGVLVITTSREGSRELEAALVSAGYHPAISPIT
ncbi:MAG: prephenate dehydrogenase/arogenate dehydrogenase family protein [Acidimicrobiia bacterium]|nr:prephenate dehydrogenase/arogenate dehydrogenase family protein [Acidimicrobiia bacterium]